MSRRAAAGVLAAMFLVMTTPMLPSAAAEGGSLEFFGTGSEFVDRVEIPVDPPTSADVGDTDFTIELWVRPAEANTAGVVDCSAGLAWINGNVVLDRDRYSLGRKFGVSLAGGRVVFGVSGASDADSRSLCAETDLRDGAWHHIAVQRRSADGFMWVFIDGTLEASGDGPDGNVSYPDGVASGSGCGGCTTKDPYLVIGAEKHDAGTAFPSYHGLVDEVRISTTLRYSTGFAPPSAPFTVDGETAALWHMDEGSGTTILDGAGNADGALRIGGIPEGPAWSDDSPFGPAQPDPDDPFIDDDDSVFESDIEWLASVGITTGCGPGRFCPDDPVTRGQMAAFLRRALDRPGGTTVEFVDDDGSVFESDIEWLASVGITTGCAPGRFCPDDPVSRGQMAAFLHRALDVPPGDAVVFSDDDGSVFESDIEWLASVGITTGCAPGRFCPDDPVTRGQMAAFLHRALDRPGGDSVFIPPSA